MDTYVENAYDTISCANLRFAGEVNAVRIENIRLSFQGRRVYLRVYSPDDKAPAHRALFVSSPMGDMDNWDELARMLTEGGCLCVAAELPGFGRGTGGAGAMQDNDTRSQILWGILDEVEKRRNEAQSGWHLIGHGSGCCAVLCMAMYQPDSALSRVLISPVLDRFTPLLVHKALVTKFGDWLVSAWHRLNILNTRRFSRLAARVYGENVGADRLKRLQRALTRKGFLPAFKRALREGYILPEGATSVDGPLMLIWGASDRIFGGQIPSRLLRRLPDAEKHLVRSAHMSMETHPDMLKDYLRGWFRFAEGREKVTVSKPRGTR